MDVHTSYRVHSMLFLTSWKSRPQVCCSSCGRKAQLLDACYSFLLGWWGFPWGLVLTPVQVGRNLIGLLFGSDSGEPSDQLRTLVSVRLGAELVNRQQTQSGAEPNTATSLPDSTAAPVESGKGFSLSGSDFTDPDLNKKSGFARRWKQWVLLLILASLVFPYLQIAIYGGYHRKMWLLNGLSKPYSVKIEGKTVVLKPYWLTSIELPEGKVRMEVTDSALNIPPQTVEISTSFWKRPLSEPVIILNPDTVGVVVWSKTYYVPENMEANVPKEEYKWMAGAPLMSFSHVDFAFKPFPDQIQLSGKKAESKVGVNLPPKSVAIHPLLYLSRIAQTQGKELAINVAQKRLLYEPDQEECATFLMEQQTPEEFLTWIRPKLDQRPALVQLHRAYQRRMMMDGKTDDLEREYNALLTKEPDNPDWQYLAGRATQDHSKAIALFQKAAGSERPSMPAMAALAQDAYFQGEYGQAADWAKKASSYMSDRLQSIYLLRCIYLAAGRYDEALDIIKQQSERYPGVQSIGLDHVYLLDQQNDPQKESKIQGVINHYTQKRKMKVSKEDADEFQLTAKAMLDYSRGRPASFSDLMHKAHSFYLKFQGAVAANNLSAAEQFLPKGDEASITDQLILSLAAFQDNNFEMAQKYYEIAREALAEGATEQRRFARALQTPPNSPQEIQALMESAIPQDEKRILMALLGMKDPVHQQVYFAMARKLNWDKRFPYLLVNRFLDSPSGASQTFTAP